MSSFPDMSSSYSLPHASGWASWMLDVDTGASVGTTALYHAFRGLGRGRAEGRKVCDESRTSLGGEVIHIPILGSGDQEPRGKDKDCAQIKKAVPPAPEPQEW